MAEIRFRWAAVALLAGGCTSPATSEPADRSESVRLALLKPSAESDMAGLEGVLGVDGPCLYIAGPGATGRRTTPAFLIAGIAWDARRALLVVGDKSFAPGDHVLLTGSSAEHPDRLEWVQRPDPSCPAADVFVTGAIDRAPLRP